MKEDFETVDDIMKNFADEKNFKLSYTDEAKKMKMSS
jgi:hypothetical protein